MGRAGRNSTAGGALRGSSASASPLNEKCKTPNQSQALAAVYEAGTASTDEPIFVPYSSLINKISDPDFVSRHGEITPEDFRTACKELQGPEGIDAGSQNTSIALLEIDQDPYSGKVHGMRALTEQEFDQRKFLLQSHPTAYAHELSYYQRRNEAALGATQTPDEKSVIEAMVSRSRMTYDHPENFWRDEELAENLGISKAKVESAIQSLSQRKIIKTLHGSPDGPRHTLIDYHQSRYSGAPMGFHENYKAQFGEERWEKRWEYVSERNQRARALVEPFSEEEAVLAYVERDNPYLDDDSNFVSYNDIKKAMRPIQSGEEVRGTLNGMVQRGIFKMREGKGGGREYSVSNDLMLQSSK